MFAVTYYAAVVDFCPLECCSISHFKI